MTKSADVVIFGDIPTYSFVPSYHGITKDTLYRALTGDLWCVLCEDFGENWSRYNGAVLYYVIVYSILLTKVHFCVI